MPANNFTTGRDVSLVFNGPGAQINTAGITDFSAKPLTTTLKSKPLSGVPQHAYIPDGWELSFKLDRLDPSVDTFWNTYEANYYAGINQPAGTINENIQNPDGSVSKYRYTGVVIKLDSPGDFSGDKKVEQTLSGMASLRIQVA
jgi:hypothetical protein